MGVSMKTVVALRQQGHDVIHLRDQGLHRLSDADILFKASSEARIVVTFELDFGDLLAAGLVTSPSVVIFRLRNPTPPSATPRLLQVISELSSRMESGLVVIVEEIVTVFGRSRSPPSRVAAVLDSSP